MQLAARLLLEIELGLAEIATEIGYESEFAFGRAHGVAPGRFRQRIRTGLLPGGTGPILAAA